MSAARVLVPAMAIVLVMEMTRHTPSVAMVTVRLQAHVILPLPILLAIVLLGHVPVQPAAIAQAKAMILHTQNAATVTVL